MAQLKNLIAGAFALLVVASACEVAHDKIQSAFAAAILGGVVAAILLSLMNVITASLPLCCGIGEKQVRKNKALVAASVIILGTLCCFIPLFASMGACKTTADTVCNDCSDGCTNDEREAVEAFCNLLGFFGVYMGAYGWVAVILGIVSASMGCCICCSCCKLKDAGKDAGTAVTGEVVVVGQAIVPPDQPQEEKQVQS
eukprot:CAMPEP_0197622714 /NCGR_PEP_ID=MMETSP1338-20131121/2897_1 /TAXON_ID=43686 ORGANISM="Pelagodinium beii, Strain RCC1491" /NCGR_SAMPLE_ID=MMETSP1338 /ASSEMBLY_ACC=CAM_ASM_000754 /LENGTH=198 /DNA_ID=CAMNT_0043192461 /DNA_START=63 /DNA_END=659 /DNA_ORIENTATION=+